jgi:hypothetical protein
MHSSAQLDQLEELRALLHEYDAAMKVTCDPDEKWRLYRNLQELRTCIESLRQLT